MIDERSYGCLMINFNIPKWEKYITTLIDTNDIYDTEEGEFGLEKNSHITVFYGFHEDASPETIKPHVYSTHKLPIKFVNISMFESDEYDVLKFDVQSKKLHLMNTKLKNNFEHTTSFPTYHPHVTIAYLIKGKGKKYIKKIKPFVLYPSTYEYSTVDDERTQFDTEK